MKRIFIRLIALVFLNLVFQANYAQGIDSMMSIYDEQFPNEKIHIHFDKPNYNKEETIWYKVYVMAGTDLSGLSKNVYVEWYDTTGKMIKQTVAPLFQSTAKGAFELPEDYKGSFIHIKAYTRWMLNDDPVFSYEKELAINKDSNMKIANLTVNAMTKVEIFPEGGFLVQGLNSRIAFKATNQYGSPVLVKGLLVNNRDKVIDTLKVQHDGMGTFSFTPSAGQTYKLTWTDENGKTGTTPIEITKTEGVCMKVTATKDNALVQVERTKNIADNFRQLILLVHMNQKLFYKAILKPADKLNQLATIPIEELPTGILQFSLFTADWIPVAERILFVNNHLHEFNAKMTPQLVNLEKRGKNIIDILVSDTTFANMSISITDAGIGDIETNTIYSDILLNGDLKGKIYHSGYYFTSEADSIKAHLDLVMLTNGWRRFDWDKIKTGILPIFKYPAEKSFSTIAGKVVGVNSISPSVPLMLNVIIAGKDSSKNFMFIPILKDGSFNGKDVLFYDTARIFYGFTGNNKHAGIAQVHFENGLIWQTAKSIPYYFRDPQTDKNDSLSNLRMNYFLDQQEQLNKRMAAATLQEVIVRSKVKNLSNLKMLEKKYTSGLFSGGDGYSFDLTDDPFALNAPNIFTYLQGKVAGLTIGSSGFNWRDGVPDIYINEVKSDLTMVGTLSVNNIAYVKVFLPPFIGSTSGGSGGAIAVYTRKGLDERKSSPNSSYGMENTILVGYSRFKEYYNPTYETPNENPEVDVRSTLYWNPYVLTSKKNPNVSIQFYNNDISKKLRIVLEGINGDGKMTRVVKLLE